MGSFYLPSKSVGAGAPAVEDGLALARFDDLVARHVESFVTASDKFGHEDDGNRLELQFTLVDEAHAEVFDPEAEDQTKPIQLRNAKSIKPGATGERSNFYEYLTGLLTPQEFAIWEAATEEAPADFSQLPGRVYNVKISHSKSGWPQVESIIGIAKKPKA